MKAAILFETNGVLEVVDGVELPKLKPGQVSVKMEYSGICHSQLAEADGLRGEDHYLPHMLGHEGVGKVIAVGAGVTKVKVDDIVVLGWIRGEGMDAGGSHYKWQDKVINAGGVTTFSEETVVSENRLVKLPNGMPKKLAVLLGCALPTGMGLVFNEAQLPEGKSVAVFGLGGIGLSSLIAAGTRAPKSLIAIDIEPHKLELAKKLGATDIIDLNRENATERLAEICPEGIDYAFEASGQTKIIELAFENVKDGGGMCIFASHPKEGETINLEPHAFHRGKQIRGSWGGGSKPDRDIPLLVDLYNKGKLPNLELLLSEEYSLENINTAMSDLRQRRITRAIIAFE